MTEPDYFRAKVFRDRLNRCERGRGWEHRDRGVQRPAAKKRALRYADRQYGVFDLIELEPD
jgi:hypothetical protein